MLQYRQIQGCYHRNYVVKVTHHWTLKSLHWIWRSDWRPYFSSKKENIKNRIEKKTQMRTSTGSTFRVVSFRKNVRSLVERILKARHHVLNCPALEFSSKSFRKGFQRWSIIDFAGNVRRYRSVQYKDRQAAVVGWSTTVVLVQCRFWGSRYTRTRAQSEFDSCEPFECLSLQLRCQSLR